MIVRVWGHANGDDIEFTQSEGDIWVTTIPHFVGRLIVDIYALKDNGLSAYVAKILFTYSGHQFTIKVLERGYSSDPELNECISKFVAQFYSSDIEKGGYIGEYQVCS